MRLFRRRRDVPPSPEAPRVSLPGDRMTGTTADDVRAVFGACMERAGVERRGRAWMLRAPEVVTAIDLQRSSYGPAFYCNVGFWLTAEGVPDELRLKTYDAHVRVRAEVQFQAERHRIAALLDAAAPMSPEARTAGLDELVRERLVPFCASATTVEALRALHQGGALAGAGVRAPAQRLLSASSARRREGTHPSAGVGRAIRAPVARTPMATDPPDVLATFAARAAEAFAPMGSFGLREVDRSPESLRLENRVVFVEIRRGRGAHHLSVSIGRLGRAEAFTLHEALEAFAPGETAVARLQATDPGVQRRALERIAATIAGRLHGLLDGDAASWARLAASVSALRRDYTLAAQYGPTMEAGDAAWRAKDRDGAREAYAAAEPALDRVRLRRLRFLRSRADREAD